MRGGSGFHPMPTVFSVIHQARSQPDSFDLIPMPNRSRTDMAPGGGYGGGNNNASSATGKKRPRHQNGGGGGHQQQHSHPKGNGGGGQRLSQQQREEKRVQTRVQEMELLRKRVVEEAPEPGQSVASIIRWMDTWMDTMGTVMLTAVNEYTHRRTAIPRGGGHAQDVRGAAHLQGHAAGPRCGKYEMLIDRPFDRSID